MKKTYNIYLHGCDDSTYVEMELDEQELALIKALEDKVNKEAQEYCQPSMEVKKK